MFHRLLALVSALALLLIAAPAARAKGPLSLPFSGFAGPVFGLTLAPDDSLLVADAGAGIVELRKGKATLVAALPGASDVDAVGRGSLFAITDGGEPGSSTAARLYRVTGGKVREVADLGTFEAAVNPTGGPVESNPFDVAALSGGQALVADAAGNSLLIVDQHGGVDWVATFPSEPVSTTNVQRLLGCPDVTGELAFLCGLDQFEAEAVPTSVAVGPDGAYYVGELKGLPAPTGESRVWRVEPGARHAECGVSAACSVVADGFTAIVDLAFGLDGTLYVVELDEGSWLAPELGQGGGGTVNTCTMAGSTWSCAEVAGCLAPNPTGVAVGRDGSIYAALLDFGSFQSQIVQMR